MDTASVVSAIFSEETDLGMLGITVMSEAPKTSLQKCAKPFVGVTNGLDQGLKPHINSARIQLRAAAESKNHCVFNRLLTNIVACIDEFGGSRKDALDSLLFSRPTQLEGWTETEYLKAVLDQIDLEFASKIIGMKTNDQLEQSLTVVEPI